MSTNNKKNKIFIASSSEGLSVTYAIQENLEHSNEITPWSQGFFGLSESTLDSLVKQLPNYDFGIFVFSFEDIIKIRNQEERAARDNVIFELGLFIGSLGKNRCFIVKPKSKEKLHLPTDLIGYAPAEYPIDRTDKNLTAALGPACYKIQREIDALGNKSGNKISAQLEEQIIACGLSAFYQTRLDYGKYRKDASSIDRYISTATSSIHMVSINLTTGIPIDGICNVFKDKIEKIKDFEVYISLINPENEELLRALSPILDSDVFDLSLAIKNSLSKLNDLRSELPKRAQKRLIIKTHETLPFASAIMIDCHKEHGKIQIETKAYKAPLQKSFAFEISNSSTSDIFQSLRAGYVKLIEDANLYNQVK